MEIESWGKPMYHHKTASLKVLENNLYFRESGRSNDGHLRIDGGNMLVGVIAAIEIC